MLLIVVWAPEGTHLVISGELSPVLLIQKGGPFGRGAKKWCRAGTGSEGSYGVFMMYYDH